MALARGAASTGRSSSLQAAEARFHAEHEREYSYRRDGAPLEIYQLQVTAVGVTPKPEFARHAPNGAPAPSPRSTRPVYFEELGDRVDAEVYARDDLPAGDAHHRARPDRPARLDDARAARRGGGGRRVAEHPHARRGCRVSETEPRRALDPVTFEVLKNAFVTSVDLMAEQILRTCYSFVIYARDFSSALCDREGNTIMQGSQDIAVHVGTLHFTCKAVIDAFRGDIHPGDVFAVNDPYLGGTHFNDVRIIRPIFHEGEIIAYAQSNGHWADVGGSVPGSFDINAKDHFGEGLRIPPIRLWDQGRLREDIVRMICSASRAPRDVEGDMHAQTEATRVCEREILRLVDKYGIDTIMVAFDEVQDYVERLTRQRVAELPDGTWETEDYIDYDPDRGEGLSRSGSR